MLNKDFNLYCDKCGEKLTLLPTTEDSVIIPGSLYAYTKYAQEKMVADNVSGIRNRLYNI